MYATPGKELTSSCLWVEAAAHVSEAIYIASLLPVAVAHLTVGPNSGAGETSCVMHGLSAIWSTAELIRSACFGLEACGRAAEENADLVLVEANRGLPQSWGCIVSSQVALP